jgi:4-hydroxy-tetrahydrodipicolinate reductase
MIKLGIAGVAGRMGITILKLAAVETGFAVVCGLEKKGHPMVGRPLNALASGVPSIPIADDLAEVVDTMDVLIDFSQPDSSLDHFRVATAQGKAVVIGTTGFSATALEEIRNRSGARVVISPNMSIGVNVMFDLVSRAARALAHDYDVEIVEMHHRWKKDAPSGTAVRLRNMVEQARPDEKWVPVSGRDGIVGERKPEELAVLAVRGGDIVGEHTVLFAGLGERVEITHRAQSREIFGRGALVAAKWLMSQPPGIYDMKAVLGLGT